MRKATIWASIVLTAAALSGCSKVLDFRNAEISNGMVYEAGANKPFSGKLTNVPDMKIFLNQYAWGRALRPVVQTPAYADNVKSDGSLCETKVRGGAIDSTVLCTLPRSEIVLYEVGFAKGVMDGAFRLYDGTEAKRTVVSALFKNGKIDGKHEFHSPKSGRLLYQATYEDGLAEGEEMVFDEATGNKIASRNYKRDLMHGDNLTYASDGKTLLRRIPFKDGKLSGLEEVFYTNGSKRSASEYKDNQRHGIQKAWDEDGKLVTHHLYDQNQYVRALDVPAELTPHTADTSTCVDKWIAAHRKMVGPDAAIRVDQLGEWREWCQSGKQPT